MVLSLNGETWYGYAITVNTSTYYFYYCFEFVNLSKMFNIGLWTKKFYRKHVIEKEFFKTEELVGLDNRYELATVIIWVISLIAVLLFHVAIMVMIHLDECTFDPTNRRHKIIVTSSCNWMEKTNYANAIGMSLLGTLAVVARVATFIYLECYQKLILKEYSDGRRVYFTLSIIFTILITTGFGWTKLFTKIRELQIYGKDFECGIMRVLLSTFVFTLPSTLFLPVIAIVNLKIINFKQYIRYLLSGENKTKLLGYVSIFIKEKPNKDDEETLTESENKRLLDLMISNPEKSDHKSGEYVNNTIGEFPS